MTFALADVLMTRLRSMNRILAIATNLFPIWVLLGGALALAHPAWFTWFNGEFIT
jgi:hypothetical protein